MLLLNVHLLLLLTLLKCGLLSLLPRNVLLIHLIGRHLLLLLLLRLLLRLHVWIYLLHSHGLLLLLLLLLHQALLLLL